MKTYKRALTIAGSDSGGGAGIQADLKTFGALGCYGASVITVLTAQNTQKVSSIYPVKPSFVKAQIQTVLEDIGADCIKIGMLFNEDIIEVVADSLAGQKVVLDPVMVAKTGDRLLQEKATDALVTKLMPLATLITPNLDEAAVILGHPITDKEKAAEEFLKLGAQAVLIKGGHDREKMSSDFLLCSNGSSALFSVERIETKNSHGTGCTLSAAITAFLAHGQPLQEAVQNAKNYLTEALQEGSCYSIGKGYGPVHHFYRYWS